MTEQHDGAPDLLRLALKRLDYVEDLPVDADPGNNLPAAQTLAMIDLAWSLRDIAHSLTDIKASLQAIEAIEAKRT